MKLKTCYVVASVDRAKEIIFIESANPTQRVDLARAFREIESNHYKPSNSRPWRVIYKDTFGVDYEVKLDYTKWPRSYANWDRRYNPDVTTEKWHGHVWDALKGVGV